VEVLVDHSGAEAVVEVVELTTDELGKGHRQMTAGLSAVQHASLAKPALMAVAGVGVPLINEAKGPSQPRQRLVDAVAVIWALLTSRTSTVRVVAAERTTAVVAAGEARPLPSALLTAASRPSTPTAKWPSTRPTLTRLVHPVQADSTAAATEQTGALC